LCSHSSHIGGEQDSTPGHTAASALLCIGGALFLVLAVTSWPYQAAWGLATSAATFREALKVFLLRISLN